MRWGLLGALALACAAWAQQGVVTALDCGVVITGSVGRNLTDRYLLNAQAGDSILVRLVSTTADLTFAPAVTVADPSNKTVAARPNPVTAGASFAGEFDLRLTGQFQIRVQNLSSVQGTYLLVYTWLNKGCTQATLGCGAAAVDQISGLLQLKNYQFPAKAGDVVSARLSKLSGSLPNFSVAMYIYVGGQLLSNFITTSPQPGINPNTGFNRLDFQVPTDGNITFIVFDPAERGGNYAFSVVRLSGPSGACSANSLTCGSAVESSLTNPLSVDAYNVSATDIVAGDLVAIRTSLGGGPLVLKVSVYDSQGRAVTLPAASATTLPSGRVLKTFTFTAAVIGPYTVFVEDQNLINTGSYTISMLRLNRPCANPKTLTCGSVVDGSVSGLLGTTQYALPASANDSYILRLLHTDQNSSFVPRIDLYNPQGTFLQALTAADLTRLNFTTPTAGVYTLLVTDGYDNSQTGSYSLSLLRVNSPCNVAGPLTCGAAAAGSLARPLASAVYSYSAGANESFTVRLMDSTGAMQTDMEVYDAQSNLVGQATAGAFTGVDVTRPAGGTYNVVVMDNNNHPGAAGLPFAVEAMRTVNACGTSPAAGQTVSGLVSGTTPLTAYRIQAASGDALLVRSAAYSGNFSAQMDLYDPSGTRLDSATFGIARTAAAAGTYTVVVGATAARTSGSYALSWQLLNNPAGAGALACGGSTAASLTASNAFRYYQANASAGDMLRLIFTRLSDNFQPQIELYDPTGARLAATSDILQKAAADGNYLVIVSPSSSAGQTGLYSVAYQRPNHPCSPAPLTCGQTTLRQVGIAAQLDTFTFAGAGGDVADVKLAQRSGNYSPLAELYDGAGNRLGTSTNGVLKSTLAASGTYALLVRDLNAVNTGSYRVTLQDDTNTCAVNDTEAPVISLIHPTAGEVITGGSSYLVQWLSDDNVGVASHDIALSTDGGQTFGTAIATGVSGNSQSYSWLTPADIPPTRKAMIRVTAKDAAGNSQAATSGLVSIIGSGFTSNSTATNTYDALNRLTQAVWSDGRTIQYTWDAAGNLVSVTVSGQ